MIAVPSPFISFILEEQLIPQPPIFIATSSLISKTSRALLREYMCYFSSGVTELTAYLWSNADSVTTASKTTYDYSVYADITVSQASMAHS